ncbi:MAG: hypothetical protein EHM70_19595 [Chloroflexota bacterium]|nr:MAG: hypothetical protein EHM70_19595 [Chloroflexota bacterium]
MGKHIRGAILSPFFSVGRLHWPTLLFFVFLNGLVLLNACLHDPLVNYDARHHLKNIELYSQFHVPGPLDSREFFSPPLPYLVPAFLMWTGVADLWGAAKVAQLLNVLFSIGLTYYLLLWCELVSPGRAVLKSGSLAFLGMLPVYYKTFSLVRGETFVAFCGVFVAYLALYIFYKANYRPFPVAVLGVALALGVWARQWSFFFFPALMVFAGVMILKRPGCRVALSAAFTAAMVISFVLGSWFYLRLLRKYGSVTAFNREPEATFTVSNLPGEFYVGLGSGMLFSDPVRPNFPNQLWPIFYSEVWGDYWGYFLVYGKDTRTDTAVFGPQLQPGELLTDPLPGWLRTNRYEIDSYLGRVNLVSLLPTAVYLLGFAAAFACLWRFFRLPNPGLEDAGYALCLLMVLVSLVGYSWFLIQYPNLGKGDTIKATYLVYIFPFLAVLASRFVEMVREKSQPLYRLVVILLALVFVHNLPAMLTRYIP